MTQMDDPSPSTLHAHKQAHAYKSEVISVHWHLMHVKVNMRFANLPANLSCCSCFPVDREDDLHPNVK